MEAYEDLKCSDVGKLAVCFDLLAVVPIFSRDREEGHPMWCWPVTWGHTLRARGILTARMYSAAAWL